MISLKVIKLVVVLEVVEPPDEAAEVAREEVLEGEQGAALASPPAG